MMHKIYDITYNICVLKLKPRLNHMQNSIWDETSCYPTFQYLQYFWHQFNTCMIYPISLYHISYIRYDMHFVPNENHKFVLNFESFFFEKIFWQNTVFKFRCAGYYKDAAVSPLMFFYILRFLSWKIFPFCCFFPRSQCQNAASWFT